MRSREGWLKDVARRQDNIDPIRRIPDWALVQGTVINGNYRLHGLQRVGVLIAGLFSLT